MHPDETYRAFLLGTADEETEVDVEEGLLDGRIDAEYLRQIEEELIDDLVFGRLSREEERRAGSGFLASAQRARKVEFARALQAYAARQAPHAQSGFSLERLRRLAAAPWVLPLAGALSFALIAAVWLGARDLRLSRDLAQANRQNEEQQHTIDSLLSERQRHAGVPAPESSPALAAAQERGPIRPIFHLSLGEQRGAIAMPVFELDKRATQVSMEIELPFDPGESFLVELRNAKEEVAWSKAMTHAAGSFHGKLTISLPATLLSTGQYRLSVQAGDAQGRTMSRFFRVGKG